MSVFRAVALASVFLSLGAASMAVVSRFPPRCGWRLLNAADAAAESFRRRAIAADAIGAACKRFDSRAGGSIFPGRQL